MRHPADVKDGTTGSAPAEFYTLSPEFIRKHHDASSTWQKVKLRGKDDLIAPYRDDAGFELIAAALGVDKPRRMK